MKILVHLHVFYLKELDYYLSKLSKLKQNDLDIYITYVDNLSGKIDKQYIHSIFPNAIIISVPNVGYDIAPFLSILRKVNLDKYSVILKLHTKNPTKEGAYTFNGKYTCKKVNWRNVLVEPLISSPNVFYNNVRALLNSESMMIASGICIVDSNIHTQDDVIPILDNELNELDIPKPNLIEFVAGTMFMCKPEMFNGNILKKNIYFPPPIIGISDISHAYERIFGIVACADGKHILEAPFDYSNYRQKIAILTIKLLWDSSYTYLLKTMKFISHNKYENRIKMQRLRIKNIMFSLKHK